MNNNIPWRPITLTDKATGRSVSISILDREFYLSGLFTFEDLLKIYEEADDMPQGNFKSGDYVLTSPEALIPNAVGKIVDLADDDYPGTTEHFIVDFEEEGTCTVHINDMVKTQKNVHRPPVD